MKEVFPGVYLLTVTLKGFSPGSVNAYLIRAGENVVLVDTGWDIPSSVSSLEAQLAEVGLRFTDVKQVILTHCHSDHLGMMRRFKESFKATVCIHRNESDLIKFRYTPQNDYWDRTDRFLFSRGMPESALSAMRNVIPDLGTLPEPDIWLEGGEEIKVGDYTLRVINTPGHTPGHLALYEPNHKFLISGDTLLPTIATNAATHIQIMDNPLQQYLDSLNRLKEMDIAQILPGHEYIFSNYRQRIEELFEHHLQKEAAVRKAISGSEEALTAYEVAILLPYTLKGQIVTFDKLGVTDKRFAMMQAIAHLEALVSSGVLNRFSQNGKILYQAHPAK